MRAVQHLRRRWDDDARMMDWVTSNKQITGTNSTFAPRPTCRQFVRTAWRAARPCRWARYRKLKALRSRSHRCGGFSPYPGAADQRQLQRQGGLSKSMRPCLKDVRLPTCSNSAVLCASPAIRGGGRPQPSRRRHWKPIQEPAPARQLGAGSGTQIASVRIGFALRSGVSDPARMTAQPLRLTELRRFGRTASAAGAFRLAAAITG